MAKTKKKRNKHYQGTDAPVPMTENVHRYTAVHRGPIKEWWHTRRKMITRIALIVVGGGAILWLLIDAMRTLFR